jgi:DNA-binding MarR family transcriptional regulator
MLVSRSVEATPSDGLIEEALTLHQLVCGCLHSLAVPEWIQLQLTISQVKALFTIATHGPLAIGSVARRLGVSLPTASTLVESLVGQGYVSRREDASDRRRVLTALTPEGERLVDRLRQGSRQALRERLVGLGEEELRSLVVGLRAVGRELSSLTQGGQ